MSNFNYNQLLALCAESNSAVCKVAPTDQHDKVVGTFIVILGDTNTELFKPLIDKREKSDLPIVGESDLMTVLGEMEADDHTVRYGEVHWADADGEKLQVMFIACRGEEGDALVREIEEIEDSWNDVPGLQ